MRTLRLINVNLDSTHSILAIISHIYGTLYWCIIISLHFVLHLLITSNDLSFIDTMDLPIIRLKDMRVYYFSIIIAMLGISTYFGLSQSYISFEKGIEIVRSRGVLNKRGDGVGPRVLRGLEGCRTGPQVVPRCLRQDTERAWVVDGLRRFLREGALRVRSFPGTVGENPVFLHPNLENENLIPPVASGSCLSHKF